jgi:hypothetical protein
MIRSFRSGSATRHLFIVAPVIGAAMAAATYSVTHRPMIVIKPRKKPNEGWRASRLKDGLKFSQRDNVRNAPGSELTPRSYLSRPGRHPFDHPEYLLETKDCRILCRYLP